MPYNPQKHNRKSIRLKGYNYRQAGSYFVTMCVQHRIELFGMVREGKMILNEAGEMIRHWYDELENKYPDIRCGPFVVMPNHVHAIIINTGDREGLPRKQDSVGLDTQQDSVRLDTQVKTDSSINLVGPDLRVSPDENQSHRPKALQDWHDANPDYGPLGDHRGTPLWRTIQWFKTMSTNEYIRGVHSLDWDPFPRKLWQRNYYEHIIRNEQSWHRIAQYIQDNPLRWEADRLR